MRRFLLTLTVAGFVVGGIWLESRQVVQGQEPAKPVPGKGPNNVQYYTVPVHPPVSKPPFGYIAVATEVPDEVHSTIQQYISVADADAKATARDKAIELLGKAFDTQQKQREEELQRLEAELAQLREKVKKRASMRRQLIEHRFDGLVQDAEGLGWGANPPSINVYSTDRMFGLPVEAAPKPQAK